MDRNEQLEKKLDRLFTAYRDACPAPEPGVNFMPEVWARIDARRGVGTLMHRWAQAFLVVGATACLLLGALSISPWGRPDLEPHSYVEILAEEQSPDRLVFQDVAYREGGSPATISPWQEEEQR